MQSTVYRTCPLCEATCGLELTLRDREILSVRGDPDDVFSRGFICPKGVALRELESDPDKLRTPLVKRGESWTEVSWDEAFVAVDAGLAPIIERDGRDAVAVYLGNPNAHNLDAMVYGRVLLRALGTSNVYSASTVDQMPKQVSAGLMFGTALSIPVPDLDRTSYLLMLGANPFASNGSLCTAPDFPGRMRAIRARGGKVVVVDPRRTQTAKEADEHVAVRPGTDAYFLFGIVHTLFEESLADVGHLAPHIAGLDEVRRLAKDFSPGVVEPRCGVPAETIRRLARELAAAPAAAVYGRIGTCTQAFGTTASWLVDVCNVLTGNLDRPGGAMFTKAAAGASNTAGTPGRGRGLRLGRRHSRVRGLPEVLGEFPVVCLAEEILTPGPGQVRGLITIAGNPVLSTPDGTTLERAIGSLRFMVSVDTYLNETTRHADVILPAPGVLARGHYDLALYQLAVRNVANYSPPLVPLGPGEMGEWEILARLALVAAGQGAGADVAAFDELVAFEVAQRAANGHEPAELVEAAGTRRGPERVLDIMLRTGPYKLSLDELEANPHGVDLGPLEPRIPELLRTPSGKIELAPEAIVADVERLQTERSNGGFVLIGRRHLRSNNSWMHNLPALAKGKDRCTLQVNDGDAERLGLTAGDLARVTSRVGSLVAPVEPTDEIMPGVVSLPHGWGHDAPGTKMGVAGRRPGVNSNVLADRDLFDPLSGNAVLNGIPVDVQRARGVRGESEASRRSTVAEAPP